VTAFVGYCTIDCQLMQGNEYQKICQDMFFSVMMPTIFPNRHQLFGGICYLHLAVNYSEDGGRLFF
jgi:hypothetical protein